MQQCNGTEAQNSVLLYTYLPQNAVSLSQVVTALIEHFLPEQHWKDLFYKYQMDPSYRPYTAYVPTHLHGRPCSVILHCLAREEKTRKTLSLEDVKERDNIWNFFSVRCESGNLHTVNFGGPKPSCTCQDWVRHNIPYKHFFIIFTIYGEWGWNTLPLDYRNSPCLCCDTTSAISEISIWRKYFLTYNHMMCMNSLTICHLRLVIIDVQLRLVIIDVQLPSKKCVILT